jgi:hypothetical protein
MIAGFVLGWDLIGGSAVAPGIVAGVRIAVEGVGMVMVSLALKE